MRKDKRDELTILCDELEHCNNKLCVKNEIVCAKKKIRDYAENDINKQLKLKALIDIHDEGDKVGFLNYLSMIISVFSFCAVVIHNLDGKENPDSYSSFVSIAFIVIIFMCMTYLRFEKKINARKKWRKYIKIALYDMEKRK